MYCGKTAGAEPATAILIKDLARRIGISLTDRGANFDVVFSIAILSEKEENYA